MAHAPIIHTLLAGMWTGYRRWMSLFNTLSILLSVVLAVVILGFAFGVRGYVDTTIRKEAAAGAVRVHHGGWQPEGRSTTFREAIAEADDVFAKSMGDDEYLGFHPWWRSEAHFLNTEHPADAETRGIFTKLGNTYPDDPEAARVASFALAGGWVTGPGADEIVLSSSAALKLTKRLPGTDRLTDLLEREIWITLPGTNEHAPSASARVRVVGIYEHLRDQASMTTPGVIQQMVARIRANANGKWFETYDRLSYSVQSIEWGEDDRLEPEVGVPLICLRTREYTERWVEPRGPVFGIEAEERAAGSGIPESEPLRITVEPEGVTETLELVASRRPALPAISETDIAAFDAEYPKGVLLCSPRAWADLGYEAALFYDVRSWEEEALYAYYYFADLRTALEAREQLGRWGFETYMPIDRYQGLVALVRLVTWSAAALLAAVLVAGLLGIAITLYSEVDAEESEIGLLKALGASNRLVGGVFLFKGALIGLVGVAAGIPLAQAIAGRINRGVTEAVAETVGIANVEGGFLAAQPWMLASVALGVVLLASLAALMPALQAAAKDPQDALRAE
jgi:hypothetical protein